MKSLTLVTKANPSLNEVREVVEHIPGGFWDRAQQATEGGVNRPDGCLYISFDPQFGSYYQELLDDADQQSLAEALRQPPGVAIHLHLSVSGRSKEIAQEVADAILDHWGGVVLQ
jgi:hypothetical protein